MVVNTRRSKVPTPHTYYKYLWGPNFGPFSSTISCFWITTQFCENYTEWHQNELDIFKVKSTHMNTTYTAEAQIFICLALRWAVFEIRPFFGKCTEWPQMTLTCSRSKIPLCMLHAPRGPDFRPFHFMMSSFQVTPPFFLGKCIKWPQMTLVKNTNMHAMYTHPPPPKQKFLSVSFYDELFLNYGPILGKVHRMTPNDHDIFQGQKYKYACHIRPWGPHFRPLHSTMSRFRITPLYSEKCTKWPRMTLTCSGWKIPICMLHTPHPRGPNFHLSCSTISSFRVVPFFSEKCTEWPQNYIDMFKVKNTNMHSTCTPEAHIFVRFALRWAIFELRPIRIPHWVQCNF